MERLKALFQGSSPSRVIFKNAIWLIFAEGLSTGLKFILTIYSARMLGATEYGTFTFALGFVSLFGLFLDAGLNQIVVRDFAKSRENEKFFPALFTLQIVLAIVTVVLVSSLSFAASPNPEIRWMIAILSFYLAFGGFLNLLLSVFRARQRMKDEIYPRVFVAAVTTALGLAALYTYRSAMSVSYAYLIGAFLALINCMIFFQIKAFRLKLAVDIPIWKMFLKNSFSLALLGGLSSVIYNNLDSSLLGFFGNLTENGYYSAAYKILLLSIMPLVFITQSFFPALSVAHSESNEKLQKLWNREVSVVLLISLPISVGGVIVAPQIIHTFYSEEFQPAILALQLLFGAMFFIYVHHCYNHILVVLNRQRIVFIALLVGVLIDLVLNLFLIPRYSLYGAATAAIATHFLIFVLLAMAMKRYSELKPINAEIVGAFFVALISSAGMYLALQWAQLSLIPQIALGIAVYFSCVFAFKLGKGRYSKPS